MFDSIKYKHFYKKINLQILTYNIACFDGVKYKRVHKKSTCTYDKRNKKHINKQITNFLNKKILELKL